MWYRRADSPGGGRVIGSAALTPFRGGAPYFAFSASGCLADFFDTAKEWGCRHRLFAYIGVK